MIYRFSGLACAVAVVFSAESTLAQSRLCPDPGTAQTLIEEIDRLAASSDYGGIEQVVTQLGAPTDCPVLAPGQSPRVVMSDLIDFGASHSDADVSRAVFRGVSVVAQGQSGDASIPVQTRIVRPGPLLRALDEGATPQARWGALHTITYMLDQTEARQGLAARIRERTGPAAWENRPEDVAEQLTTILRRPPAVQDFLAELRLRPGLIGNGMARCRIEGRYRSGDLPPGQDRCAPRS